MAFNLGFSRDGRTPFTGNGEGYLLLQPNIPVAVGSRTFTVQLQCGCVPRFNTLSLNERDRGGQDFSNIK